MEQRPAHGGTQRSATSGKMETQNRVMEPQKILNGPEKVQQKPSLVFIVVKQNQRN